MSDTTSTPTSDDLAALDHALEDGGADGSTRRGLLAKAAAGAAAGGVISLGVGAGTADALKSSTRDLLDVIATNERFGVTFLGEAFRRAPGTPSAKFQPIIGQAATEEFDHLRPLRRLGGRPLVSRFWIPETLFGAGGAALFKNIETVETIEISSYLAAVTVFARGRSSYGARTLASAMAVEAEHRTLARSAQMELGTTTAPPNDRSFELYANRTASSTRRLIEGLGIGLDRRTSLPGRFYDFPGDPSAHGQGLVPKYRTPPR